MKKKLILTLILVLCFTAMLSSCGAVFSDETVEAVEFVTMPKDYYTETEITSGINTEIKISTDVKDYTASLVITADNAAQAITTDPAITPALTAKIEGFSSVMGEHTLKVTIGDNTVTHQYRVCKEVNGAELRTELAKTGTALECYVLTENVANVGLLKIMKSVVIYGVGHTITRAALSDGGYAVVETGNTNTGIYVEINDIDISITGNYSNKRGISVHNISQSTIVLNNVDISSGGDQEIDYAINISVTVDTVNLIINKSEIEGWSAINSHAVNSTITINDSKLTGDNKDHSNESFNIITQDGNSLFSDNLVGSGTYIEINNSELIAIEHGTGREYFFAFQYSAGNNTAKFTDCTFKRQELGETLPSIVNILENDNYSKYIVQKAGSTGNTLIINGTEYQMA